MYQLYVSKKRDDHIDSTSFDYLKAYNFDSYFEILEFLKMTDILNTI